MINQFAIISSMNDEIRQFLSDNGKKGGTTTNERHPNHLKEISKLGVGARRKKLIKTAIVK